ncbi:MAG TPA: hypothetical protein EYQ83_07015 [Acidobacteria bacterium]|nr:hypothetical protein [Acidobacteriota bacterium]
MSLARHPDHRIPAFQWPRQRWGHEGNLDWLLRPVLLFLPCFVPLAPATFLLPRVNRHQQRRRHHFRERDRETLQRTKVGSIRLDRLLGRHRRRRRHLNRGHQGGVVLKFLELQHPVRGDVGLDRHRVDVDPFQIRRLRSVLILGRQRETDPHGVANPLDHQIGHRRRHPNKRCQRWPLLAAAERRQHGETDDEQRRGAAGQNHRM